MFFGRRDTSATPDNSVSMECWDGYAASRARVTNSMVRTQVRNPIVLTGDVYAHWASDMFRDFDHPGSPVVASEFVTSSITSGADGYDERTGQHPWAAYNPNLKFWTNLRGYVNTRLTPTSFTVDYRSVPQVTSRARRVHPRPLRGDDGVRGMRQTFDNPARRGHSGAGQ